MHSIAIVVLKICTEHKSRRVNDVLRRESRHYPFIIIWEHNPRFPFSEQDEEGLFRGRDKFSADGVHLTSKGQYYLYKSIKDQSSASTGLSVFVFFFFFFFLNTVKPVLVVTLKERSPGQNGHFVTFSVDFSYIYVIYIAVTCSTLSPITILYSLQAF